jgi:hypothetical protein
VPLLQDACRHTQTACFNRFVHFVCSSRVSSHVASVPVCRDIAVDKTWAPSMSTTVIKLSRHNRAFSCSANLVNNPRAGSLAHEYL